MIHYRKILELHDEGISLRGISASTGNSRQKVTEVIELAEKKELMCPLDAEMDDRWIEEFLFPEKSLECFGRQPLDFEYIHKELARLNVTLSLLHHEYEAQSRANISQAYTTFSYLFITILTFVYFSHGQLEHTVWPTLIMSKIIHLPFIERFEYIYIFT